MSEFVKGGVEFALFLTTLGLMIYGIDTVLDSQNNLSEIKEKFLSTPPISAQCDPDEKLDMACMTQITREVCDGNNTLDRSDDICETLDYWYYVPAINVMR